LIDILAIYCFVKPFETLPNLSPSSSSYSYVILSGLGLSRLLSSMARYSSSYSGLWWFYIIRSIPAGPPPAIAKVSINSCSSII
jgi:hypothetical protein